MQGVVYEGFKGPVSKNFNHLFLEINHNTHMHAFLKAYNNLTSWAFVRLSPKY